MKQKLKITVKHLISTLVEHKDCPKYQGKVQKREHEERTAHLKVFLGDAPSEVL
jgi:hypothetical protein